MSTVKMSSSGYYMYLVSAVKIDRSGNYIAYPAKAGHFCHPSTVYRLRLQRRGRLTKKFRFNADESAIAAADRITLAVNEQVPSFIFAAASYPAGSVSAGSSACRPR